MGKKSAKTPQASSQEVALADVAKKKFETYKRLYRPLGKEMLKRSSATEGKIKEVQGLVNADVQQASAGRDSAIAAAGLRGGLKASDSRVLMSRGANQEAIATARGAGSAAARQGVMAADRAGKEGYVALGHGIARQSIASQTGLAQDATSSAIQAAQLKLKKADQIATGLGSFFGAAAGMSEAGLGGGGTAARPQFGMYQLGNAGSGADGGAYSYGGFTGGRSMR